MIKDTAKAFGFTHFRTAALFGAEALVQPVCGADLVTPYARCTRLPPMVTCAACQDSQEYKDALYELEIGFDGDIQAYAKKIFAWMING